MVVTTHVVFGIKLHCIESPKQLSMHAKPTGRVVTTADNTESSVPT